MKDENRKYHHDVLSLHNSILFDTLIYPHNISSDTLKEITFQDKQGNELMPLRGYFAYKEMMDRKVKYFIDESIFSYLPIRVNQFEELMYEESTKQKTIIIRPIDPTPFKIVPQKMWNDNHQFIDEFCSFENSHPRHWTLIKVVAIMGFVGKVFVGICSKSEFGKSSIFETIHSITQKSPVFQPRSVPGILAQITGDGNIVFDEVHEADASTKRCMENFALQVAGNKPIYINGALKSAVTKSKYDVSQQSITFLYNDITQYKDTSEFFDNIFSNNRAIDTRFLKLKFEGILIERFDKDFDLIKEAETNKMYYIKIAKHLAYLKELKLKNGYTRRYTANSLTELKGRRKIIYDEITWGLDIYCASQQEFDNYIGILDDCIIKYREMVNGGVQSVLEEEII